MRPRATSAILGLAALAAALGGATPRLALAQDVDAPPAIVLPALPDIPADSPAAPAPGIDAAEAKPPAPIAASSDEAVRAALAALVQAAKQEAPIRGALSPLARRRAEIGAAYGNRGFAPLWINAGTWTPAGAAALDRLAHAADDGLDLRATPLPALTNAEPGSIAAADVALSAAVVEYAWQASGGRVDPATIGKLIDERPRLPDTGETLATVSASADAGAALLAYNPPQSGYQALRQKLADLRRAPAAASALLAAEPTPAPRGKAAPAARQPLGAEALESEIIANMELWRWEPRVQTSDQIEVNIPDYSVKVTLGGAVALRARVIVGQPTKQTPVFSNQMKFIEVNPYWNVPDSIIKKEMLPKLAGDPNYFQRMGYEVSTSRSGRMIVRQPPGERNALGRIKFMFPNDHAVYLHDTPSRGLFNASRRALSHGCVRVDDPMHFAETVLGKDSGWDEARIKRLIGGKNQTIPLPRKIDIHIEYFTAFVDDDGGLRLRDDIYGYSRRVREALGLAA